MKTVRIFPDEFCGYFLADKIARSMAYLHILILLLIIF